MLQALPPIRLLDLHLRAVALHAQDLVIILALAPLQRRLRFPQLRAQRLLLCVRAGAPHPVVAAAELERLLEVLDGGLVLLEVQLDAGARAEGLEGGAVELDGGVGVEEGVVVAVVLEVK